VDTEIADTQLEQEKRPSGALSEADLADLVDNAPKCQPGKSMVDGYGLIASEPIASGETIIDFSDPAIYRETTFDALEDWRLEGGKYTGLSEERCVISDRMTKYSLLNHSRNPNAISDFEGRKVVALRDIQAGEEVTVDYRREPISPQAKAHIQYFL
jgi:SET domain-containing protein